MDGRIDFFFGMESVTSVTSLKLPVIDAYQKKTHPNLTAQVENMGGKINYRATFIYHLTIVRTRRGKVRPVKTALPIYTNLAGYIYVYLPTEEGFFLRVK